jgi:hypothetical protein
VLQCTLQGEKGPDAVRRAANCRNAQSWAVKAFARERLITDKAPEVVAPLHTFFTSSPLPSIPWSFRGTRTSFPPLPGARAASTAPLYFWCGRRGRYRPGLGFWRRNESSNVTVFSNLLLPRLTHFHSVYGVRIVLPYQLPVSPPFTFLIISLPIQHHACLPYSILPFIAQHTYARRTRDLPTSTTTFFKIKGPCVLRLAGPICVILQISNLPNIPWVFCVSELVSLALALASKIEED